MNQRLTHRTVAPLRAGCNCRAGDTESANALIVASLIGKLSGADCREELNRPTDYAITASLTMLFETSNARPTSPKNEAMSGRPCSETRECRVNVIQEIDLRTENLIVPDILDVVLLATLSRIARSESDVFDRPCDEGGRLEIRIASGFEKDGAANTGEQGANSRSAFGNASPAAAALA